MRRSRGRDMVRTMKPEPGVARLRVVRPAASASEAPPPSDLDGLYRRYAVYVAAIATRLLGRDAEVDDLVQDVFLDVLRGIGRLREPQAFKGWLAQITVRRSIRRLKQRNLRRALHLETDFEQYASLAGADASVSQRVLIAKIYRVLDVLPAQTRVIWVLRHVLSEPLHAVAELCECSQSTVQRRLREAEAVIDRELGDE